MQLLLLLLLLLLLPLLLLLLPLPEALLGAPAEANGGGRGCGTLNYELEATPFFVLGSDCAIIAACLVANNTNTTSALLRWCSHM